MPLGIFLTDAVVKRYIENHYAEGEKHAYAKNRIVTVKYHNHGAAFEFVKIDKKRLLVMQGGLLLAVIVVQKALMRRSGYWLAKAGMALLIGGGASNFYDRCKKGYVVDYFHINVGPKRFRRIVYNISDICIFAGAALTVIGARKRASGRKRLV